ncbi:MAG: hypothetical protein R3F34_02060 [Planctomycetota bacterium]
MRRSAAASKLPRAITFQGDAFSAALGLEHLALASPTESPNEDEAGDAAARSLAFLTSRGNLREPVHPLQLAQLASRSGWRRMKILEQRVLPVGGADHSANSS